MNTKTFAQESRRNLLEAVSKKLHYWGFNEDGSSSEQPQPIAGGYSFRGQVYDDPAVPKLWNSLKDAVNTHGVDVVIEKAAYTWFNRITALRILSKNGYEQSELEYVEGMTLTPQILQKARQGKYAFLSKTEQERLQQIITDYSKDQEAFAILLIGYCHSHPTLKRVFGGIDDYTELLLPANILQESGFLHLLNTTDAISDEEYQKVELIGWLYQFYISEKKDEVFASFKKNKKAEAKDIPAATQIFTPNWIVKYMVENTAGKIWLDKNPSSPIKSQMKYLVENECDGSSEPIISGVEELTLIDPACGSGHILVEGFDLIYQMYMEEYYTPEEAVHSILKNNLFGLDIDDRAGQLATFAILLKAAKHYSDVWEKYWLPNVYAMPEAQDFSFQEIRDFLGSDGADYEDELEAALRLMKQAKNLGSVMKLSLSEEARSFINNRFTEIENTDYRDFNLEAVYQNLKSYIPVLLILTKKYTSVVANPPYMGQKNMNGYLKSYVTTNYPRSKSDLFAVFMESTLAMNIKNGLMGMINQHSWMFLSSYEKLRNHILDNYGIVNMLHLGPRTFEELSGEVVQSTAFVLQNGKDIEKATYYRLVDYKNVHKKEEYFLKRYNEFVNIPQSNFSKIPENPIAYWVSKREIKIFDEFDSLGNKLQVSVGLQTGNNSKYIRNWSEVDINRTRLKDIGDDSQKWFPLHKGGTSRKWYGNLEYVINWENNGLQIKNEKGSVIRNSNTYLKKVVTWTKISGGGLALRYTNKKLIHNDASCLLYSENQDDLKCSMGALNSKVKNSLLENLSPTLNFVPGQVSNFPIIKNIYENSRLRYIIDNNIKISENDWDSRETSWDFEQSPLLNKNNSLEQAVQAWQEKATQDFFQLHTNEEELNRIFIDIYGLQEELTPDVALKDITILQEELSKNDLVALEDDFRAKGADAIELPIDKGEVISQFISYAIGLFMGRYRLDQPGLNIAHPNPTQEELASYSYKNGQVIIDEDAILPLMGKNCNFPDDALQQFQHLLDTIWGHETRTENINFIQDCLDKDLEKFLVKDFYKYHCKMYKKKPIYWLFASPKGAFQVLVYMHRMNAFTVEKIRANYLLEHIKNIHSEIMVLEGNASNLNTQEAKRLDTLRVDLRECEAYDMELKNVADQQISFDLDDGVTVNYKKFETVVAKIK